jgi:predicted nucleotidyltransferase
MVPDLDLARRFVALRPPPGRLLLLAVTGSHHYGFSSPDSDIDLKGIHAAPTRALLGLRKVVEAHDALEVFEGTECDLTTHELSLALRLLLRGNGNMLERIFSPFQVVETDALDPLRTLARGSLSKQVIHHYGGYFRGMCKEHEREPTVKSLLYTFRVALTGIHLLRTGEVLAHLPTLLEIHPLQRVPELIARKVNGREKDAMSDAGPYRALWPSLETELEAALAASPLPNEPANSEEIEAWLVGVRVNALA